MVSLEVKFDNEMEAAFTLFMIKALREAQAKHSLFPSDVIYQAAIVSEECGELVRASLHIIEGKSKGIEELQVEILQTAAMCCRMFIALPQTEKRYFEKEVQV